MVTLHSLSFTNSSESRLCHDQTSSLKANSEEQIHLVDVICQDYSASLMSMGRENSFVLIQANIFHFIYNGYSVSEIQEYFEYCLINGNGRTN